MSDPISVGDLVMVVRGHSCIVERCGGHIYRVIGLLAQRAGGWTCNLCWTRDLAPDQSHGACLEGLHLNRNSSLPLSYLKKIDPPGELDDVKRDEEITA